MTDYTTDDGVGVLRSIWQVDSEDASDVGELRGNTTVGQRGRPTL